MICGSPSSIQRISTLRRRHRRKHPRCLRGPPPPSTTFFLLCGTFFSFTPGLLLGFHSSMSAPHFLQLFFGQFRWRSHFFFLFRPFRLFLMLGSPSPRGESGPDTRLLLCLVCGMHPTEVCGGASPIWVVSQCISAADTVQPITAARCRRSSSGCRC